MKLLSRLYISLLSCWALLACRTAIGQTITSGSQVYFGVVADSPNDIPLSQPVAVFTTLGSASVHFKLTAVNPTANGPNFIVVTPPEGSTPVSLIAAPNLNVISYLPPGKYGLYMVFSSVDTATTSNAEATAQLEIFPPPPPSVTSVVSAASLQPLISPGEIVSIFGANIGTPPVSSKYDYTGLYPTTLGNTTVTFGGTLAPLLYVSTNQINAVVPFEVAGQKNVDVIITHDSVAASAVSVAIVDTSPAIFTTTQNGTGQGAIQNTTGANSSAPNSVDNPAPKGSGIAIYATGGGLLNVTAQDGTIFPEVLASAILPQSIRPAALISLTIGGQPAKILFAGAAPYEVAGMLQINAVIPAGIGSGPQPVVLTIGDSDSAAQKVTVAVK